VGAEDLAGEPGQGVGVLVGPLSPAENGQGFGTALVLDHAATIGDVLQCLGPLGFDVLTVLADERNQDPVVRRDVLDAEPGLVRQPAVVGGVVVDTREPEHHVVAGVDLDAWMGGVEERRAVHLLQVPGAGTEPVRLCGGRPHGADLHRVPGEVRAEGLVWEGVHLDVVPAVDELDERVARHLFGEPGAAGAEDATLPVEQHQLADRDGLLEGPLELDETALTGPVGHGLVLERALPTLVTDRAVERVIDQQVLENGLLGLGDGGALGVDDHPVVDRRGARGHEGGAPRSLALDQTHAAHAHGGHALVPAEPRDVGPLVLGGLDQQLAGGHLVLHPVDGDRDRIDHLALGRHSLTPAWARLRGKGQPPFLTWASTSSRKYSLRAMTGETADGPSGQIVVILGGQLRPTLIPSDTAMSRSRSIALPCPSSIRRRIISIQVVPSRQGVHWPHDSWAETRTPRSAARTTQASSSMPATRRDRIVGPAPATA